MTSKLSDMLFLNTRFSGRLLSPSRAAAPCRGVRIGTAYGGDPGHPLAWRRAAGPGCTGDTEEASMRHRFLAMLPALVLGTAALPGLAQACQGVISTSEWRSDQTDRGYWAASFRMRNVSQRTVQVLVIPRGEGAVLSAPVRLAAGQSVKVWPFRTPAWMPPRDVERGVTLQCTVASGS
jgi:hypothetical protein